MGLTFLAPLFLAGLVALAVPIVIHLVHRQKPEGTAFPSLMFLQKIPYKAQRRQKIRHWFLFLLRCAALVLLALAFARPLLRNAGAEGVISGEGRELVVLVDRSFSMAYGGRWDQAVEAARRVIEGMGPEDRASLVVFDQQAQAVSQPVSDRAALLAALNRQERGDGTTNYSAALRLAQQVLSASERGHREIVLITDFQRSGRHGEDAVRLADGIRLTPVDLSTGSVSNAAVASIAVTQRPRGDREEAVVSARVVRWGGTDPLATTVRLALNGQELGARKTTLAPSGNETVVFDPVLVPLGTSRGIVTVDDPQLEGDNDFSFVLTPGRAVSVLVLQSSNARANQSLFLQRALGVGDQPSFRVDVKPVSAFRLSDLDNRAIVVVNDAPFPSGDATRRLVQFVEQGGGLLVALGDRTAGAWPSELGDATGVGLGDRVERTGSQAGALTTLDYTHPVFEVFSGPRSGDFTGAKVFRYRGLRLREEQGVMARFDDGAPALVERRLGKGKVLLWTTTLDTYWNDLPLQPVFLPLVHQAAKYLASYRETRAAYVVGEVVDLGAYLAQIPGGSEFLTAWRDGDEMLVEAPSGARERFPAGETAVQLSESGFHEVRPIGRSGATPVPVALNVAPAESDLSVLDVQEFVSSVSSESTGSVGVELVGPASSADLEKRQRLWWFLMVGALAVLLGETLVSNRLSRAVR